MEHLLSFVCGVPLMYGVHILVCLRRNQAEVARVQADCARLLRIIATDFPEVPKDCYPVRVLQLLVLPLFSDEFADAAERFKAGPRAHQLIPRTR